MNYFKFFKFVHSELIKLPVIVWILSLAISCISTFYRYNIYSLLLFVMPLYVAIGKLVYTRKKVKEFNISNVLDIYKKLFSFFCITLLWIVVSCVFILISESILNTSTKYLDAYSPWFSLLMTFLVFTTSSIISVTVAYSMAFIYVGNCKLTFIKKSKHEFLRNIIKFLVYVCVYEALIYTALSIVVPGEPTVFTVMQLLVDTYFRIYTIYIVCDGLKEKS